jgi:hypothetical protein
VGSLGPSASNAYGQSRKQSLDSLFSPDDSDPGFHASLSAPQMQE